MSETQYNWELREFADSQGDKSVHLVHLCPRTRVMGSTVWAVSWLPIKKVWACDWCEESAPPAMDVAAKLAGAVKDTTLFNIRVATGIESEATAEKNRITKQRKRDDIDRAVEKNASIEKVLYGK